MIQLALMLKMKMTTVQDVETSVTVNNNSPIQLCRCKGTTTVGQKRNFAVKCSCAMTFAFYFVL